MPKPQKVVSLAERRPPTAIQVDSGIPIPTSRTGRKYPFDRMRPGDSFFLPGRSDNRDHSLRNCARCRGLIATVRRVTENGVDGVRCWVVETVA